MGQLFPSNIMLGRGGTSLEGGAWRKYRGEITVTSSLNQISTDQLGNRGGWGEAIKKPSGEIFKDDVNVNGFSSTSIFALLRVGGRKARDFCHAMKINKCVFQIRRKLLDLPDPDPDPLLFVRIRSLPSSSKKIMKNLKLYSIITSTWLVIFEDWCIIYLK